MEKSNNTKGEAKTHRQAQTGYTPDAQVPGARMLLPLAAMIAINGARMNFNDQGSYSSSATLEGWPSLRCVPRGSPVGSTGLHDMGKLECQESHHDRIALFYQIGGAAFLERPW